MVNFNVADHSQFASMQTRTVIGSGDSCISQYLLTSHSMDVMISCASWLLLFHSAWQYCFFLQDLISAKSTRLNPRCPKGTWYAAALRFPIFFQVSSRFPVIT